jgi:DHA1 family inner membrane transport protein
VRNELRALTRSQVWLTAGIGAIGFGGLFSAYSYIAPVTTEVAHLPAAVVPLVLVVFGVGMTIGNLAGGRFADHGVRRALLACFVAVLLALAFLAMTAANPVGLFLGVLLVGITSSALSPALQVRLMDVAKDSTTIAAAGTHSAMNIGNSLGAAAGAAVLAAGFGYVAPIEVGILLTAAGLLLALVTLWLDRTAARPVAVPPGELAGPEA